MLQQQNSSLTYRVPPHTESRLGRRTAAACQAQTGQPAQTTSNDRITNPWICNGFFARHPLKEPHFSRKTGRERPAGDGSPPRFTTGARRSLPIEPKRTLTIRSCVDDFRSPTPAPSAFFVFSSDRYSSWHLFSNLTFRCLADSARFSLMTTSTSCQAAHAGLAGTLGREQNASAASGWLNAG